MNIIKRIILFFRLYEMDILIDGQDKCLAVIKNPSIHFRITIARSIASRERTRLRGEYNATFKPGKRITWRMA